MVMAVGDGDSEDDDNGDGNDATDGNGDGDEFQEKFWWCGRAKTVWLTAPGKYLFYCNDVLVFVFIICYYFSFYCNDVLYFFLYNFSSIVMMF